MVDEPSIALVERGVAGILRHLGMRSTGPSPVEAPDWISRNEVLRAGVTGIFYPAVERGTTVTRGATLGRITDFHGNTLEEIVSSFDGEVLYVLGTPPINKGEPVAMVGASRM